MTPNHVRACGACGAPSSVKTPSKAWWIAVVALWVPTLFFGACAALMLPLNLVLVPCWLACASSVGALSRRITEPRCEECSASGARIAPPEVARRTARPADEGAMEGALVREADA